VCCSVLQCVAVCCSVLQCVAAYLTSALSSTVYSVVATLVRMATVVCCSEWQYVAVSFSVFSSGHTCGNG